MNNKQQPIGIFDSGIGGLTVLKKLNKILPNEEFMVTKVKKRLLDIVNK